MDKEKKTIKIKNIILNILIVICLCIAVGSGIYIAVYYYKSSQSEKKFDVLKDSIDEDAEDENGKPTYVKADNGDAYILAKYQRLYNSNNDFIGWLKIDGTSIDYPVMYTPDDPEYYLHRDFDEEYSAAGTLFVDSNATPIGDKSDNILIYGHNMKSGTMFRDLLLYEDEEFYKEHKYIKFDTLDEVATYEIIAAMRTVVYSADDTEHFHYYEFFNAENKADFDEYIDFIKQNTPYTINTTASYGDSLITLSTCAYHDDNGRYVVVAKKIDDSEK